MNVSFDEIDLKEDGDEAGVFTGYGSTFGGKPDSYGDIVVAGAFRNTLAKGGRNGNGVAMLWQHEMHNPIGIWE
ncbi:HK97 family phage prohead protease, partial [Candidatus Pacearchaeota archaeon]|nr:HK97 family phage prohead protease [Candidatus Pacearchaeota archaeon]